MEDLRNIEKTKQNTGNAEREEARQEREADKVDILENASLVRYVLLVFVDWCCHALQQDAASEGERDAEKMCVNTEWGGLGDDGSLEDIITPYDAVVNQMSINPGKQRLETLPVCLTLHFR